MRKLLSYIGALFPLAAITLLFLAPAASSLRPAPSDPSDLSTPTPAPPYRSATFIRREALRVDYENVRFCRVRAAAGRTPAKRAAWQRRVRQSLQKYNAVAARADDSDFAATALPRHLNAPGPDADSTHIPSRN